jgi:hypothetical protein
MGPIAIVTCVVGVLYIVGRGPHVFAPVATIAYYRRVCSSPERIRLLGVLILAFVAVPLIVTARQTHAEKGDITIRIEAFGWIVTALMIAIVASPRWWHRFANAYWDSDPARLWLHSLIKVSFGFFLCWVAFVVL